MIARDKNHPCVVMWSIANEPGLDGGGERPQQAYDYFRPLYELARINAEIDKRPWFIGEQLWISPSSRRSRASFAWKAIARAF